MNNRSSDFQNTPSAGHIYVNGYGFVNVDPRFQQERSIRKNAAVTGLALTEILVLSLVCPYLGALFLRGLLSVFNPSGNYAAVQALTEVREIISYLLSMGIPLVTATSILRPQRGSISLRRAPANGRMLSYSILAALAVSTLMGLVSSFTERIFANFHILELTPDYLLPSTSLALLLYLIRLSVLPALIEEFLFRGVLLRSLRQFGDAFALITSSVAFGLIHYSITKDMSGFVLGLILGYYVIRTGSVYTAVISRFLSLLVPLCLRLLQHIAPHAVYQVAEYSVYALILAVAIGVFILICRKEGNAFILSSSHTEVRISRKLRVYFLSAPMVLAAVLWIGQILRHIHFIG